MKSPLPRRIAVVALVLAAPAAAGCTNGFGAQTDQAYQPAIGVNDNTDTIDILNAAVVSGSPGEGTFSVSLVNRGDKDNELVSVTGSDVTAQFAPIALPSNQLVNLSDKGQISVSGPKVAPGNYVELELTFRSGASEKVNVPVVGPTDAFSGVPLPSGSSSATPAQSASESPSATASASE